MKEPGTPAAKSKGPLFLVGLIGGGALTLALCGGAIVWFIGNRRDAAHVSMSKNNLIQTGIAVHNFHETHGRFRGTGVLVRQGGQWKIAHYALSFLVLNENWEEVVELTRKTKAAKAEDGSE